MSVTFQFGKNSRFDRYEDDLAGAEDVNLLLYATAMEHSDVAVGYLIPDPELDGSAFRLYEHQCAGEHLTARPCFG